MRRIHTVKNSDEKKSKSALIVDLISTSVLAVMVIIVMVIASMYFTKMDSYEKAMQEDIEQSQTINEEIYSNIEILMEE